MPGRLAEYRRKHDFSATPEPGGRGRRGASRGARFVVHLHHARSRHFDFRLQVGETLRSWAVPKGPSLDPQNKRLAVEVEDHPLDYGSFEGIIPEGHYGAGKVWIWDEGRWTPDGDPAKALKAGRLHFSLDGTRLHGEWSLVRTRLNGKQPQWLLIKSRDGEVRQGDEADDTPLSEWHAGEGRPARRDAGKKSKPVRARRKALPAAVGLQLARLAEKAPAGQDWLHEVKYDGYRVLLWRDGKTVRITSRGDQDWSAKLAAAAEALRELPCGNCILDGELVALDADGRSSFGRLQQLFGEDERRAGLSIMLFDLLWLDGEDLRGKPQLQRKQALEALLRDASAPLHYSQHRRGGGTQAAGQACKAGLEGIICKHVDAPYEEGRGGAWLKVKCVQSEEYAVVGYTRGKGARAKLGSLLLARPEKDGWRYMGRVGTGLNDTLIEDLLERMKASPEAVPLQPMPDRAQLRGAKPLWVKPELVVEAEFRGLTEDGLLRQASLKGLRQDRSVDSLRPGRRDRASASAGATAKAGKQAAPRAAHRTAATGTGGSRIRLTHPERVLFADPGITKAALAAFYSDIADFILPGMRGRPVMVMRCPDGDGGDCFFQKHLSRGFPGTVREVLDPAEKRRWITVDDLDGLLGLVQMSALEYHVWGSTAQDLDHADRVVIDLDPAPDVEWKEVVQAALDLRRRLEDLGLGCFVRTTGGKGLHVVLPLHPAVAWDEVRDFSRAIAETLAREEPERYVAVASKARRGGRIFVDYLRNARGATAIASYSLRHRPGAPIATPLRWEELARVRSPQQFSYASIRKRLAKLKADPWEGFDRLRQKLPPLG